jgi:aryl-alcohol dehydrogenase-like predicted oxidoreductase
MIRTQLPNTDLHPSTIALGTSMYGSAIPEDRAFELMDRYVAAGGNFLDTAHVYAAWLDGGEGASERTVGKWLASRGCRADVIAATKGAHHDIRTYENRVAEAAIRRDLHESLDRLGVDSVDLYWLHRDDEAVPVGEVLGWLGEHISAGLVRAIGCSNWSARRQLEAAEWARARGLVGFCASQVRWSLARFHLPPGDSGSGMLSMDDAMLAFHRRTGIAAVAYSAQANGFFSGKYGPGADEDAPGFRSNVAQRYGTPANYRRLAAAQRLAESVGCTPNQVALAWLLAREFPVIALCGPRTIEQLADSCAAADVGLSADQIEQLPPG